MAKNLVIVESPAKAKTIEGYLGSDFTVKSSYGHVRDLPKSDLAIDVENEFKPAYEVTSDKKQVVGELKKLASKSEIVWLATDEDREGEAISWHLLEALKLDKAKTKRIVFHEITKPAILKAIENPRDVDINLVNAQQARRVLDRLVGFELSPVLWKKIKPALSAGRVQSVAVRIIVERERDILNFTSTSSYRIVALFDVDGKVLKGELPTRFKSEEEARSFLESCLGSDFTIGSLEKTPAKKSPTAPFTTSTLQQEASRKLGFSVSQTMVVAQKLYESGRITYMRTDSVNLSDTALTEAKAAIHKLYGEEFAQERKYKSKSKGAQEAHEAIRPTTLIAQDIEAERNEKRLYDLIWKRTIASQMTDAKLEKTTVSINISGNDQKLIAKGEVIKFEGFLKVYLEGTDDEEEDSKGMLPPLKVGDQLKLDTLTASERFTHHPARFTEASLVKKLEELGIGRPSTYAPTISTIQKRGYVVKESRDGKDRKYQIIVLNDNKVQTETKTEITGAEKSKLFPTDIGMVVSDYLVAHFDTILDYNFTANVEEKFDQIAMGKIEWQKMIGSFYNPFHKTIENALENTKRTTGEREIGTHPETGKPIFAKIGRYGPMIQMGLGEDEEKKFAGLRGDQSISTITLEEALDLFKLPRHLGELDGDKVSAAIGRFGPYVRHGKTFVSLKEDDGDDPFTIGLPRAVELIIAKKEEQKKSIIKEFEEDPDIRVIVGRYGPYIKAGKKNVRIPKDKKPEDLTFEEVTELVASAKTSTRKRKK